MDKNVNWKLCTEREHHSHAFAISQTIFVSSSFLSTLTRYIMITHKFHCIHLIYNDFATKNESHTIIQQTPMLSNVSSLMEEVPKQKGEKTEHPDRLEKKNQFTFFGIIRSHCSIVAWNIHSEMKYLVTATGNWHVKKWKMPSKSNACRKASADLTHKTNETEWTTRRKKLHNTSGWWIFNGFLLYFHFYFRSVSYK